MSSPPEEAAYFLDSDEEEIEWEEVVPETSTVLPQDLSIDLDEGPSTRPNIEITLKARKPSEKVKETQKAGGISHAERMLRIDCHKMHTVALLTNAQIRNQWASDELLHARLLSLTPLDIQNQFALVHKSRIPDPNHRGTMFQIALERLVEWWAEDFFEITTTGHLRSRTFDEVQDKLRAKGFLEHVESGPSTPDPKGKGKGKARLPLPPELEDFEAEEMFEVIRSAKSLMKHALQRFGSRDVSAQLFTALCRALGLPARLVVSLQSVPWQTKVGKPKNKPKPRSKGTPLEVDRDVTNTSDDEDDDMEEVANVRFEGHPGRGVKADGGRASASNGKAKANPSVKLRKQRPKGNVVGFIKPLRTPNPRSTPPVFWTEVFSRADGRWLPIDPIRGIVNKRKAFDPSIATNAKMRVDNRMAYVIAFEEDGYARDLTPRYAREYGAKVTKVQAGGKGQRQWWEAVMGIVTRPYRLHRDDVEDAELAANQINEGMPTTMSGFKDHALYVLERHIRKDQVIAPDTPELGKFRGEPVYSRSSVLDLKTAENWMRRGRMIKAGEQPLKFTKQRASTVGRKRELEMLREAGAGGQGQDVMQAAYAERQTELYRPAPIVDGIIPRNNFGNIDLYVASMLPAGAAHIPYKGTAKIARQLGFNHAEAVTSFEFKKGRAFPVLSGIVVAAENEEAILEAYWEAEHSAAQKEHEKRQQAVIRRWTRLVQGLRLRKRLQEQYAPDGPGGSSTSNIVVTIEGHDETTHSGGFVTGADDVVQPYVLPKTQHPVFGSLPNSPAPEERRLRSSAATSALDETGPTTPNDQPLYMSEDEDEDQDMAQVPVHGPTTNGTPKTMAEWAAEFEPLSQPISPSVKAIDGNDSDGYVQPTAEAGKKARRPVPRPVNSVKKNGGMTLTPPAKSSAKPNQASATKTGTPVIARKRTRRDSSVSSTNEDARLSVARPSAAKRTRVQTTVIASSDRVLRTRKGKSAAAALEEAKMEKAYREAIEG
ncbi:Rad4-domain-containing protein [Amylostereum chailletii]|nr:Rad4-domain-containing protein [Amylostereum chailletii]